MAGANLDARQKIEAYDKLIHQNCCLRQRIGELEAEECPEAEMPMFTIVNDAGDLAMSITSITLQTLGGSLILIVLDTAIENGQSYSFRLPDFNISDIQMNFNGGVVADRHYHLMNEAALVLQCGDFSFGIGGAFLAIAGLTDLIDPNASVTLRLDSVEC